MKKIKTCGRCEDWQQDKNYTYEGICGLFPKNVTRDIHACGVKSFKGWEEKVRELSS